MDEQGRHVLAEAPSPIGVLQIVAYRQDGVTWVGIARRDAGDRPEGGLIEAIGLRTRSHEMQIEGSVSSDKGFSYVAGAVAPTIVRAEIRDRDGQTFPATIVDIPDEIEQDYRAVWAILDGDHKRSRLVGYDERGVLYDWLDPRVFGPPPSDGERMNAIRRSAHDSLRYNATALLRAPEHKKLIEANVATVAHFMAILEADATDSLTVMARVEKIKERYREDAKENPWVPPEPPPDTPTEGSGS